MIDGIIALIGNPAADLRRADRADPGPGLPHRRLHLRPRGDHLRAYRTGRGIVQMRARAFVETQKKTRAPVDHRHRDPLSGQQGQPDRPRLPSWCRRRSSRGSADLRDESDRDGMRIVIDLKTRRESAGHPQPALQADPDAVLLRHQHAGHRRAAGRRS
ncbi:MAG: hypothetical protein M0C28_21340 [Candidatus Moduliflexus flocculans]|nr:hypothetical protein [Candidatus Moduliflexus flocculans]